MSVQDVNDEQPRFLSINPDNSFLELTLLEGDYSNQPGNGKLIENIQAIDDDGTAPNNQVQKQNISTAVDLPLNLFHIPIIKSKFCWDILKGKNHLLCYDNILTM